VTFSTEFETSQIVQFSPFDLRTIPRRFLRTKIQTENRLVIHVTTITTEKTRKLLRCQRVVKKEDKKKMRERNKHLLKSIAILLTSIIYFFVAYIGFENLNPDLNTLYTQSGIVVKTGKTYRHRSRNIVYVFYFDIQGLNGRISSFIPIQNLAENIKSGDKIKVYFKEKLKTEMNEGVVQIEKNEHIIYSKKQYEVHESIYIWVGLTAGILTVIYSWFYYKKKKFRLKLKSTNKPSNKKK